MGANEINGVPLGCRVDLKRRFLTHAWTSLREAPLFCYFADFPPTTEFPLKICNSPPISLHLPSPKEASDAVRKRAAKEWNFHTLSSSCFHLTASSWKNSFPIWLPQNLILPKRSRLKGRRGIIRYQLPTSAARPAPISPPLMSSLTLASELQFGQEIVYLNLQYRWLNKEKYTFYLQTIEVLIRCTQNYWFNNIHLSTIMYNINWNWVKV